MLRGMYAAASGMEALLLNQDLATENLANNNVTGFSRRGATFEPFEPILAQQTAPNVGAVMVARGPRGNLPQPPPVIDTSNLLWGTRPSFIYTDFTPGSYQYTGNPYDVAAINTTLPFTGTNGPNTGNVSSTYFVVQGPSGPLLTRDGAFTQDFLGELITRSGYLVLGQGGRILIPPNTHNLVFAQDGTVIADGVTVGNMLLAAVPDPTVLRRIGDTLFEGPIPNGQATPGTVQIQQFYLEQSNSNVVVEMVSLLNAVRTYEAAQRALLSLSDVVGENVRPTNG